MKKITTLTLLFCIALNVFAQQEIPMFFDNEMMLSTNYSNRIAAYSPDGSKIAIVTNNYKKIVVWDSSTGREITRLAGHGNNDIYGIVFSPNGRQLASRAYRDSTIKIWDATSGALIRNINQAGISSVSFSPDGSRIVGRYYVSETDNGIKIWNSANGSEVRTLTGVGSAVYSPDGRQIVTTSTHEIKILDAGNGQALRTINSRESLGNALYSPNGRYITAYAWDEENDIETIRIYSVETGSEIRAIPLVPLFYDGSHVYSADGRQLLVNTNDSNYNNGSIKIFDPDTGRELRSFINGDHAIAFSPDGRRILTASSSFRLKIDDNNHGASYATLLDATTGKVTGTIGYGPLNVGARAYADMQIARFLADTAAVNRHETVLKFITDCGNATRAEIEQFYKKNIAAYVDSLVNEQLTELRAARPGFNVPAARLTEIKRAITDFMLNPSTASYAELLATYRRNAGEAAIVLGYAMDKINSEVSNALTYNRVLVSP